MPNSGEIKSFLLRNIPSHPGTVARVAAERFGKSRQAINRHLRQLTEAGLIRAHGQTRAREYELVVEKESTKIPLTPGLEEDRIWREWVAPQLEGTSANIGSICHYGFTEMVNNAIDHSEGRQLTLSVERSAASIELLVKDDGVGIFHKIQRAFCLEDDRHAVLELSKGKLTTDPARHTGEGIFFTSRMFDTFSILSGKLFLTHLPSGERDWLVEREEATRGTAIIMIIDPNADRTVKEVFDRFTDLENGSYGFDVTHVPIALAQYGDENLMSRSQAKRILARVHRFQKVVLDFDRVRAIGQAFADEIFRVFRGAHPEVEIVYVNAAEDVEQMIQRALANSDSEQGSLFRPS